MNLVELALSCVCGPDDPGAVPIDCCLIKVAVDRQHAEAVREQFVAELAKPRYELIRQGCSYIHAGAEVGDQENGMICFAVGQVLGLWEVLIPTMLKDFIGASQREIIETARGGMVYNMLPEQMKQIRDCGAVV